MPKPRQLSGKEVIDIFQKFGFYEVGQKRSHVKLRRISVDGTRQTLIVPLHRKLDLGTAFGLYRQGTQYIAEADLKDLFFNE